MRRLLTLVLLVACYTDPATEKAVAAAKRLTLTYGKPELHAYVAGYDCGILVVESDERLDTTTIESMQYGTGEFSEQSVEQFAVRNRFRAIVYRDPRGVVKSYESITRAEAESMRPCG